MRNITAITNIVIINIIVISNIVIIIVIIIAITLVIKQPGRPLGDEPHVARYFLISLLFPHGYQH